MNEIRTTFPAASTGHSGPPCSSESCNEQRMAYRVFVLRCWAEPLPDHEGSSGVLWARRYSVEDVDTRTRYGFASLVELLAFLARASDGSQAMKA